MAIKEKKLLIFLTDPMKTFLQKGEIKERYYNPGDFFDEIHMISFCKKDVPEDAIRIVAGKAKIIIHSVGSLTLVRFARYFTILPRIIKDIEPQAIRAYDVSIRGFLAVLMGKRFKIPVVISLHCSMDDQRKYNHSPLFIIRKLFEGFCIKRATKIICVTQHVAEYARKYGCKDPLVIFNRVKLQQFNPLARNPIPGYVLSVGRLDRQKYHECLIRAIHGIPKLQLVLIGQGPLSGILKNLVHSLHLDERITFIDHVPNSEIHAYYDKAEIFAIATHYEGFCIPVLEAMASGVPVIASDIPPIIEISNGAANLVANDPSAFRKALLEIAGNTERKDAMTRLGLALVGDRFNYDTLEQTEKSVYEGLLNVH